MPLFIALIAVMLQFLFSLNGLGQLHTQLRTNVLGPFQKLWEERFLLSFFNCRLLGAAILLRSSSVWAGHLGA